ncbi:MAG TPA: hypothetical protein VFU16_07170 [Solirubrobacterales bacterium]|nr:hypothetical protein [Solirubrobacterales bacterium]
MGRRLLSLLIGAILVGAAAAGPAAGGADAAFGVSNFEFGFVNADGSVATQAGSHPYALRTRIGWNLKSDPDGWKGQSPDGMVRDLVVSLPAGFAGTTVDVPRCATANFLELASKSGEEGIPNCPDSSAVGTSETILHTGVFHGPVFNLEPPPGVAVKLGYFVYTTPVIIEVGVNQEPPYNVVSSLTKIPQTSPIYEGFLELWGFPASPAHDSERGHCFVSHEADSCASNAPDVPFFTLPTSCTGPLGIGYATDSWENPGGVLGDGSPDLADPNWVSGEIFTQNNENPPGPQGLTGCTTLNFKPRITAQPTSRAAQSPTGLDFSLNVNDEGLLSPPGRAQSTIRKAVVTLPEGFTTNPSLAEGLVTCSEADLARETVNASAGSGCPNASKIGTVEVESPLLKESVNGSLFIATPYENPFGSLLGLYMVIRNPLLGIVIKQPLKVENDPLTGQITTVADDLPQLPFSHFRLHFREGTRSPLASPPLCGEYQVPAVLTPWSGAAPITSTDTFSIISGPDGGPCPSGGTPPFRPGLLAGTINNAAGRYSPFYVHMTRKDGEQEITHFSIKLPPGVIGKLAGIPFCPDLAIAAAVARTGPHGGQEEIDNPSCPAASEIGRTLVGAGVGPSLAYAPGKVYLAGPYNGSQLSIAAITAAKVGPFDLGTVVVREALKVNPETAEVFVDATGSDPLPHIIKGIPVHLRDIRVYVDRPDFVLNPTSCARTSTASTVLGSGTDFASEADDSPVTVTSPFQAASCASLGFKPRLSISLKGGTKRGKNPALTAVVRPRPGDANIGHARVTLPRSEFLEQGHIKTICTRVQFNAGVGNGEQCPAASVYGRARAVTPLLDEPLSGPVFLRSSNHPLPDLVAALHSGRIEVALVGRIDSATKGRAKGLIRTTFDAVPDAPVTKFTLKMFGGKKSLLVNSTNLCRRTHKAIAEFTGQNGRPYDFNPPVKAKCKGKGGKKSRQR